MAVALLSYFSTMVTAFAAMMFLLTSVFSTTTHSSRPQPHRLSATARAMVKERMAAERAAATAKPIEVTQTQAPVLNLAAARQEVSESDDKYRPQTAAKPTQKAKLVTFAQAEKRKERLAERHQDRRYSTVALGYAPESPERVAAERIFNTIRSRR